MTYGNYPSLEKVKKILVIKFRHLGDVLLATPVLSVLKEALPEASIDVFVNKESFPLLEGNPSIRNIFCYDREWKKLNILTRMKNELSQFRKIRKEGYDLVINLTEGDRGALLAKYSKASIRVGYDSSGKGLLGKNRAFTHLVKCAPTPRHTVEKDLDALRRIGIFPPLEKRKLCLSISEDIYVKISHLLEKEGLEKKKYILIAPASRWKFKCYPEKHWSQLLGFLEKRGEKLIFCAGNDLEEKKIIQKISLRLNKETYLDLSGMLSIKELFALISYSKLLISVDSLSAHIASCWKIPLIVLFGPTCEKTWGPYLHPHAQVLTSSHSCRPCLLDGCGGSKKSDCLEAISPEKVLDALKFFL
jgi:heptosyltransferase III